MSRYYADKREPDRGYYEIEEREGRFRFHWFETAKGVEYNDYGDWQPSRALALHDAADDWDSNGDDSNRRLSGMLDALAKRATQQAALG